MGYQIGSVAMMGKDDPHSYFVFFVQSGFLEHSWINEYFDRNFARVARSLGRDGVVVVSTRNEGPAVEFQELTRAGVLRAADDRQDVIFHRGLPLLVVTLHPISAIAERTVGAEFNCVAINLSALENERELGALMDSVVDATISGGDDESVLGRIKMVGRSQADSRWMQALEGADMIELKPNFMGIGLNLNAVIDWYRTRRRRPGRTMSTS